MSSYDQKSLELEELFSDCCHEPAIYNIVPWKGGFSLNIREICFKCLKCANFKPAIQDPGQELQFKKLMNSQFEFTFNSKLYYITIESPENLGIKAPPIICLDIHNRNNLLHINSDNFDNIHDLGHELQYSQDLGPQLTTYIKEEIKKGGLID